MNVCKNKMSSKQICLHEKQNYEVSKASKLLA